MIGAKMQRRNKTTGGRNEDGCQDSSQQRDQAGDADSAAGTEAGKEQAALNVAVSLEFNPAYVHLGFGPDLLLVALNRVGVAGWNDLMHRLSEDNIVFSTFSLDAIPPVMANLDFQGMTLRGRNLDGINLRYVNLDGANLSGCSLRGAVFWWVRQVDFRHTDLRDAHFESSDITGVDFTGARTCGVAFDDVHYEEECPPAGLPAVQLAQCEVMPWDHIHRRVTRRMKEDDEKNAR